jgi:hypothetical protein
VREHSQGRKQNSRAVLKPWGGSSGTPSSTQRRHKVQRPSRTTHAATRIRITVRSPKNGAAGGRRRATYIRLMVSLRASVWASECQGCLRDWSCPVAARGGAPSLVICTPQTVLVHIILIHARRGKEGLLGPDAHRGLHAGTGGNNHQKRPRAQAPATGPTNPGPAFQCRYYRRKGVKLTKAVSPSPAKGLTPTGEEEGRGQTNCGATLAPPVFFSQNKKTRGTMRGKSS